MCQARATLCKRRLLPNFANILNVNIFVKLKSSWSLPLEIAGNVEVLQNLPRGMNSIGSLIRELGTPGCIIIPLQRLHRLLAARA